MGKGMKGEGRKGGGQKKINNSIKTIQENISLIHLLAGCQSSVWFIVVLLMFT